MKVLFISSVTGAWKSMHNTHLRGIPKLAIRDPTDPKSDQPIKNARTDLNQLKKVEVKRFTNAFDISQIPPERAVEMVR